MAINGLNDYDRSRYDRQMMIPGFGEDGQQKLKSSRIFVAGCGGLGSPVATYLAMAGFGHIIIADNDIVDLSNLNRQFLHWDANVGDAKVKSGYGKLALINPSIKISAINGLIYERNVYDLTSGCDLIIDAMDNFETRYLLNKAAIKHGIPFIHGAVRGFEGRLTTIIPGKTPCLRCIYPHPAPKEKFPVLGATPGVIGTLQAMEAVKVVLGIGLTLQDRLLIFDGEFMEFHTIQVKKDLECPECGQKNGRG